MNRILGVAITLIWLAAMAALVRRDVAPFWYAEEAPAQSDQAGRFQSSIVDRTGRRVGTSWLTSLPGPQLITVRSTTVFDLRTFLTALPNATTLVLDADLTYELDGRLLEFSFALHGAGMPINITGERLGRDFACVANVGDLKSSRALDGMLFEQLSETLRPFTRLDGLFVGRSWRIRLLDPFALVRTGSVEFTARLASVVGRETIAHAGHDVDCFRVETEGAVAWVDDEGKVLRQEVRIPLLGTWTLTDEPFDESALKAVLTSIGRGFQSSLPQGRWREGDAASDENPPSSPRVSGPGRTEP